MRLGYARVSTPDQRLDHQIDALLNAHVERDHIYPDIVSGAHAKRPQLEAVSRALRPGDTLVITRLDRLARSLKDLIGYAEFMTAREVGLLVLEQGIDTTTPEGRAMFGVFGVLAEFQRELIIANTRDGLAAARARGRTGGRKARLSPAQAELVRTLYAERRPVAQIAELVGVARSTVYGYLKTPEDGS